MFKNKNVRDLFGGNKLRGGVWKLALLCCAGAASAVVAVGCTTASADVYSGERIEVINPFSLDGSTGAWLSVVLPYLQEYTPGSPTIEQVSRSGGRGTTGANFFETSTTSDGRTLLTSSGSTVFPYLFNQEGILYDFADYTAILASPLGGIVYVRPDTGITDVAGLCNATDLVWNAVNTTGLDSVSLLGLDLLDDLEVGFNDSDADLNVIQNATSRGTARADFITGEINISYDSLKVELDTVIAEDAILLYSAGILDENGDIARDPTYPDLPHYGEVYQQCNGRALEGVEREAYLAVMVAGFGAQKVMWVKSDVPQEYIDALLEGARGVVADPEFDADRIALVGDYEFAVAEAAQALFDRTSALSDEAYEWLRQRLNAKFPAQILPRS